MTDDRPHLLYDDLAAWWPVLSPPAEYAEEASFYAKLLRETAEPEPRTVLELGSGGGNNALHMKQWFALTLVDPAPGMLSHSREINPECEHQIGDMRTFRLGRSFDGVFIQDAICYMTSEEDLRRAIETAWVHLRPG
ncbi:MAG TPA: class I SAM-dependent methyltransferase, partial [Rhodothermales bacterium]